MTRPGAPCGLGWIHRASAAASAGAAAPRGRCSAGCSAAASAAERWSPCISVTTAARRTRIAGPAVCAGTFAPRKETDRRLIAELRQQVLAPEAIAKIRTRVRELLQDLQRRGNSDAEARAARVEALQGEINRLTDAVAQMGLSAALRARLVAAETELASLAATGPAHPVFTAPSGDKVGARIREMAMRLETALSTDVECARKILADKLGDIVVEEKDDGVYAQMDIGPVLLEAAGADVARSGCGGLAAGPRGTYVSGS